MLPGILKPFGPKWWDKKAAPGDRDGQTGKGNLMNKQIYNSVISGKADHSISFSDFQNLVVDLGFQFRRQRGSHTMYYHPGVNAFMNIQKDGAKAKAYEVRQLREIIRKYGL